MEKKTWICFWVFPIAEKKNEIFFKNISLNKIKSNQIKLDKICEK